MRWLLETVEEKSDLTLEEIRTRLKKRRVRVSLWTVWSFYNRHEISFKKTVYASEQDRADVAAARVLWKANQALLDPSEAFGRFVTGISAPLGIGKVLLDNGASVSGFLCEAYAVEDTLEITDFGGWRGYIESQA